MSTYLKIVEPGWATYTGNFGGVDFVNGESTEGCSAIQAQKIANLIRVETLDGKNPSVTQQIVDSKTVEMDQNLVRDIQTGQLVSGDQVAQDPVKFTKKWTTEELEAVIEKDGINGLRSIADPLGIKGRSIAELVAAIVKSTESAQDAPTWGTDKPGDRVGGCDEDAERRRRVAQDAATPPRVLTTEEPKTPEQ